MNQYRGNQNPFDSTKASDFSDEQIYQYWADIVGQGGLHDLFKPTQQMPMLLLGGKGSGKTHLMRYYSSTVQKLRNSGYLPSIKEEGFLGIYVRADALNVGRFDRKGYSEEEWSAVFNFYFELWLSSNFLKNIQEVLNENKDIFDELKFVEDAKSLFSSPRPVEITTLIDLIEHLAYIRKGIDHIVGNCVTKRTSLSEIEICVSPGQLVFELPTLLSNSCAEFKETIFVYMIDEIENFNVMQQKFLNTLIRYRRGPTSIKVGARLYGIRTKETLGVGEQIRQDAEYEKVELDAFLREQNEAYNGLAKRLILKRLQKSEFLPQGNDNFQIDEFFEDIDSSNHFQKVTLELVKNYDEKGKERPYFTQLRKRIAEVVGKDKKEVSQTTIDLIIEKLKVPDYPLLEKTNIYIFYKDWDEPHRLHDLAVGIGDDCINFIIYGKSKANGYFQSYDHFKSDFLAQLYRDCEKGRGVYAGLETLIHLSQGVPRNLLSLLKYIYRRSYFAGEKPFHLNQKITIKSQVEGIRDSSAWFWEDAQPDCHGLEVRMAVQALAELFREIRYSPKPSECDLGTFTVASNIGTNNAREVLKHAENWSYLIQIRDGSINKNNSAAIDQKFQLSPMLAARWGVSEYRRGALAISEKFFNALFDPSMHDQLDELVKDRLKNMQEPHLKYLDSTKQQNELF